MWYFYFAIGLAAVCIGIPVFLVYRADKRKKTAYDKKFKLGRFSRKKKDTESGS